MSKTKDRTPKDEKAEKKRKRQEESDDVPKKSKKSRKSHVEPEALTTSEPTEETPVVDKKAEKEAKKQRKKERREKAAATSNEQNGHVEEAEDFIPLDNDVSMPDATDDAAANSGKKKSKKDKKDKKEKKSKKSKDAAEAESAPEENVPAGADEQNGVADDAAATNGVDADSKAAKKEKKKDKKANKEKKSKKSKTTDETSAEEEPATETNGVATPDEQEVQDGEEGTGEATEPGKKGRFIVFVGNLPYSATKESISEHFAKLHPTEIRLRTYKGTEKFMGTCFVEFDRFDRMETCLKKYHHSVFPDGKKKEGRKINVELSAGGGGNSESRKSKIVAKNDKLHDERARDREKRAEIEMKQSERKAKKEGKKGETEEAKEAEPDNAGMHPARLAMMQGPQRPAHRQRY